MSDDKRKDGGNSRRFRLEDLLTADDRPLRRDLLAQISALEHRLSSFRSEHAPFTQLPPRTERGPALLTTEQLEHVRDELLDTLTGLQEQVAERFTARLGDVPADYGVAPDPDDPLSGIVNPWATPEPPRQRLLARLRRILRDPRSR